MERASSRALVHGYVKKKAPNSNTWQTRYLTLHPGALTYYKSAANLKHPQGIIFIGDIEDVKAGVLEGPDASLTTLVVKTRQGSSVEGSREFKFMCGDTKDCQEWLKAIEKELKAKDEIKTAHDEVQKASDASAEYRRQAELAAKEREDAMAKMREAEAKASEQEEKANQLFRQLEIAAREADGRARARSLALTEKDRLLEKALEDLEAAEAKAAAAEQNRRRMSQTRTDLHDASDDASRIATQASDEVAAKEAERKALEAKLKAAEDRMQQLEKQAQKEVALSKEMQKQRDMLAKEYDHAQKDLASTNKKVEDAKAMADKQKEHAQALAERVKEVDAKAAAAEKAKAEEEAKVAEAQKRIADARAEAHRMQEKAAKAEADAKQARIDAEEENKRVREEAETRVSQAQKDADKEVTVSKFQAKLAHRAHTKQASAVKEALTRVTELESNAMMKSAYDKIKSAAAEDTAEYDRMLVANPSNEIALTKKRFIEEVSRRCDNLLHAIATGASQKVEWKQEAEEEPPPYSIWSHELLSAAKVTELQEACKELRDMPNLTTCPRLRDHRQQLLREVADAGQLLQLREALVKCDNGHQIVDNDERKKAWATKASTWSEIDEFLHAKPPADPVAISVLPRAPDGSSYEHSEALKEVNAARTKFETRLREATLTARRADDPEMLERQAQFASAPLRWLHPKVSPEARVLLCLPRYLIALRDADEVAKKDQVDSWVDLSRLLASTPCGEGGWGNPPSPGPPYYKPKDGGGNIELTPEELNGEVVQRLIGPYRDRYDAMCRRLVDAVLNELRPMATGRSRRIESASAGALQRWTHEAIHSETSPTTLEKHLSHLATFFGGASGLQWVPLGPHPPMIGVRLQHAQLEAALEDGQTSFGKSAFETLNVPPLRVDHYVVTKVGCFRPGCPAATEAAPQLKGHMPALYEYAVFVAELRATLRLCDGGGDPAQGGGDGLDAANFVAHNERWATDGASWQPLSSLLEYGGAARASSALKAGEALLSMLGAKHGRELSNEVRDAFEELRDARFTFLATVEAKLKEGRVTCDVIPAYAQQQDADSMVHYGWSHATISTHELLAAQRNLAAITVQLPANGLAWEALSHRPVAGVPLPGAEVLGLNLGRKFEERKALSFTQVEYATFALKTLPTMQHFVEVPLSQEGKSVFFVPAADAFGAHAMYSSSPNGAERWYVRSERVLVEAGAVVELRQVQLAIRPDQLVSETRDAVLKPGEVDRVLNAGGGLASLAQAAKELAAAQLTAKNWWQWKVDKQKGSAGGKGQGGAGGDDKAKTNPTDPPKEKTPKTADNSDKYKERMRRASEHNSKKDKDQADKMFDKLDSDGNGLLDRNEFRGMFGEGFNMDDEQDKQEEIPEGGEEQVSLEGNNDDGPTGGSDGADGGGDGGLPEEDKPPEEPRPRWADLYDVLGKYGWMYEDPHQRSMLSDRGDEWIKAWQEQSDLRVWLEAALRLAMKNERSQMTAEMNWTHDHLSDKKLSVVHGALHALIACDRYFSKQYAPLGDEERVISPLYYYSTPQKLKRDRQTTHLLLSMSKADLSLRKALLMCDKEQRKADPGSKEANVTIQRHWGTIPETWVEVAQKMMRMGRAVIKEPTGMDRSSRRAGQARPEVSGKVPVRVLTRHDPSIISDALAALASTNSTWSAPSGSDEAKASDEPQGRGRTCSFATVAATHDVHFMPQMYVVLREELFDCVRAFGVRLRDSLKVSQGGGNNLPELEKRHKQLVEILCALVQTPKVEAPVPIPAKERDEWEEKIKENEKVRASEKEAVLRVRIVREAERTIDLRKAEASGDWNKVGEAINKMEVDKAREIQTAWRQYKKHHTSKARLERALKKVVRCFLTKRAIEGLRKATRLLQHGDEEASAPRPAARWVAHDMAASGLRWKREAKTKAGLALAVPSEARRAALANERANTAEKRLARLAEELKAGRASDSSGHIVFSSKQWAEELHVSGLRTDQYIKIDKPSVTYYTPARRAADTMKRDMAPPRLTPNPRNEKETREKRRTVLTRGFGKEATELDRLLARVHPKHLEQVRRAIATPVEPYKYLVDPMRLAFVKFGRMGNPHDRLVRLAYEDEAVQLGVATPSTKAGAAPPPVHAGRVLTHLIWEEPPWLEGKSGMLENMKAKGKSALPSTLGGLKGKVRALRLSEIYALWSGRTELDHLLTEQQKKKFDSKVAPKGLDPDLCLALFAKTAEGEIKRLMLQARDHETFLHWLNAIQLVLPLLGDDAKHESTFEALREKLAEQQRRRAKVKKIEATGKKIEVDEKVGIKWIRLARPKPGTKPPGTELKHRGLEETLRYKTAFTKDEWSAFGVKELRDDHYVLSEDASGPRYYGPAPTLKRDEALSSAFNGRLRTVTFSAQEVDKMCDAAVDA